MSNFIYLLLPLFSWYADSERHFHWVLMERLKFKTLQLILNTWGNQFAVPFEPKQGYESQQLNFGCLNQITEIKREANACA